ncbi:MAG: hypothetical protein H7293_22675 [Candidatus Saccharibacteria bacterium]|nr:hypothetical protein [Rhodoferax sp.]
MAPAGDLLSVCQQLVLGVLFALPCVAYAQSAKVGMESLCDHDTIFANGRLTTDLD